MNLDLFLANFILVLHALIVLFVVVGFILIWLGCFLHWNWVRNFYFRMAHLGIMGVVVLQALLRRYCALTSWEDYFRSRAGLSGRYETGFIAHWIHRLLFFQIDLWVFTILYAVFFLILVASWRCIPPRFPWRGRGCPSSK